MQSVTRLTTRYSSLRRLLKLKVLNLNRASFADVLVVLSTTCPSLETTPIVIKMTSADVSDGKVV